MSASLAELLRERFGEEVDVPREVADVPDLVNAAAHRSHRSFTGAPVSAELLRTLLACALSAPSKSDLQQVAVVHLAERERRDALADLIPAMPWLKSAPVLLVFCGDSRRIRRICEWRGREFANDHLDALFNAAVDAALVLMSFVRAAEAVGLGCCPVSVVRNHAARVSELLELPPCVFPVAGLAAGYPAGEPSMSPRLPMSLTVHIDRYDDSRLLSELEAYDARRNRQQGRIPRDKQRYADRYGTRDDYGWSEDKARQVSVAERADFGRYLRAHGFRLD